MKQTQVIATVKKHFLSGLITQSDAIRQLRNRTEYNAAFIISLVKKWEKEENENRT